MRWRGACPTQVIGALVQWRSYCAIKPPSITSFVPVMNHSSSETRNSTYYSKRDVPSSVMMPARLGEGVIAMLPRSSWLTICRSQGGAARGLAEAVEGATWRYSARQSVRCLPPPMARTPARKPRVLDRGALLPDRRAAEKFGGVPMVRIHLSPAESPRNISPSAADSATVPVIWTASGEA